MVPTRYGSNPRFLVDPLERLEALASSLLNDKSNWCHSFKKASRVNAALTDIQKAVRQAGLEKWLCPQCAHFFDPSTACQSEKCVIERWTKSSSKKSFTDWLFDESSDNDDEEDRSRRNDREQTRELARSLDDAQQDEELLTSNNGHAGRSTLLSHTVASSSNVTKKPSGMSLDFWDDVSVQSDPERTENGNNNESPMSRLVEIEKVDSIAKVRQNAMSKRVTLKKRKSRDLNTGYEQKNNSEEEEEHKESFSDGDVSSNQQEDDKSTTSSRATKRRKKAAVVRAELQATDEDPSNPSPDHASISNRKRKSTKPKLSKEEEMEQRKERAKHLVGLALRDNAVQLAQDALAVAGELLVNDITVSLDALDPQKWDVNQKESANGLQTWDECVRKLKTGDSNENSVERALLVLCRDRGCYLVYLNKMFKAKKKLNPSMLRGKFHNFVMREFSFKDKPTKRCKAWYKLCLIQPRLVLMPASWLEVQELMKGGVLDEVAKKSVSDQVTSSHQANAAVDEDAEMHEVEDSKQSDTLVEEASPQPQPKSATIQGGSQRIALLLPSGVDSSVLLPLEVPSSHSPPTSRSFAPLVDSVTLTYSSSPNYLNAAPSAPPQVGSSQSLDFTTRVAAVSPSTTSLRATPSKLPSSFALQSPQPLSFPPPRPLKRPPPTRTTSSSLKVQGVRVQSLASSLLQCNSSSLLLRVKIDATTAMSYQAKVVEFCGDQILFRSQSASSAFVVLRGVGSGWIGVPMDDTSGDCLYHLLGMLYGKKPNELKQLVKEIIQRQYDTTSDVRLCIQESVREHVGDDCAEWNDTQYRDHFLSSVDAQEPWCFSPTMYLLAHHEKPSNQKFQIWSIDWKQDGIAQRIGRVPGANLHCFVARTKDEHDRDQYHLLSRVVPHVLDFHPFVFSEVDDAQAKELSEWHSKKGISEKAKR